MMNMNEEYGGPVSNPLVQQAIRKALNYENFQTICGEGSATPYSLIQVGFMGSKEKDLRITPMWKKPKNCWQRQDMQTDSTSI